MKIIFAGTPEFAVPSLRYLMASGHEVCAVYTQPDRPAGRGRQVQPSPVKQVAEAAGIPVLQPAHFKSQANLEQFSAFNADLMVVVAYGVILPQAILDAPKFGCINVHGSLLPRWRGAAPIQRAIMAGDQETGVTLMQMVLKLDAGDMLHKEHYRIAPTDTAESVYGKLAELGAIGLAEVLHQLAQGHLSAAPQDDTQVTYAEKLAKQEAWLDWGCSAIELDRRVRGLNPWPVAQTLYQGQNLRIWLAEAVAEPVDSQPGKILVRAKQLDVATGDGRLRLKEVQLPGGKQMSAQAFLNAHDLDGVVLG